MPEVNLEVRIPTRMEHLSYLAAIEANYRAYGNVLAANVITEELKRHDWPPR